MSGFAQLAVQVGAGQSGPVGLVVIVLLCLGCAFLFRSMTKRLRRVPRSFDAPRPPGGQQSITPPDGPADA